MYDLKNPFIASVKERICLTPLHSDKHTYQIILDLHGSQLKYNVGDSIGVWPKNSQEDVFILLSTLNATGDESIVGKDGQQHILFSYLTEKVSLDQISPKFFERIAMLTRHEELLNLLSPEAKESKKLFLQARHVFDFLEEFSVRLPLQEIIDNLMPMMPRFYSVSSSQKVVGDEVHLLVADVSYYSRGVLRRGVCSNHICHQVAIGQKNVQIFVQPSHSFTLTEELEKPIIMIGPGTGVAPFRGFMQERIHLNANKKNWLFFGERHENEQFFYADFWNQLVESGWLRLTTAFSRDQQHKIYVQHRMIEEGKVLYQWLRDGAYIYVCGDAQHMAKDVESALIEILITHGHMDDAQAKQLIKEWRKTKRYQRDVY